VGGRGVAKTCVVSVVCLDWCAVLQVLLEQTTVIEKELNEAIAWREAAEAKMAELGEYADTHEALTTQVLPPHSRAYALRPVS
jgi:hypothetical protein